MRIKTMVISIDCVAWLNVQTEMSQVWAPRYYAQGSRYRSNSNVFAMLESRCKVPSRLDCVMIC